MRVRFIFASIVLVLSGTGMAGQHARKSNVDDARMTFTIAPLFPERDRNDLITVQFMADGTGKSLSVDEIEIRFSRKSALAVFSSAYVFACGSEAGESRCDTFAVSHAVSKKTRLKGNAMVNSGVNRYIIGFTAFPDADISQSAAIRSVTLSFSDGIRIKLRRSESDPEIRLGRVLRAAGQDGIDTYRIPGIVTTWEGTLIAVYDVRHNSSKDLQEDIDVGMSRSTDGGQTWEPMKVIMDMGNYGGLPEQLNGIGDPSILYDHITNTVWVAAIWMSGSSADKMLWWDSRPGMTPGETGQFLLVKSTDDGITWSKPINITGQIKDPAWQLLLQGPGRGITLNDGTLVFPAQFKADAGVKALDGGQYTCYSTIVFSKDGGNTWHIGTGAKSNTTEAQVVQLQDGSLMLNMRDDRNRTDKGPTNGRAVAVTRDLGLTWSVHPSSNSALPEPNCMASLIAAELNVNGTMKEVLLFSNPADKHARTHITVKASCDEGLTWPGEKQLEIYGP
ncbi:MAG: glycoside hydrolase, partial [Bacteroidales bacterium]|nr:glycoside hydrolase [Bacteroidales bacterium]